MNILLIILGIVWFVWFVIGGAFYFEILKDERLARLPNMTVLVTSLACGPVGWLVGFAWFTCLLMGWLRARFYSGKS